MQKDFSRWHQLKETIDNTSSRVLYKEREVWWMKLGHNVGSEQNGSLDTFSRPVLIVKGFSTSLFWGAPLSNTANRGRFVYSVMFDGSERAVNLSQLRALDTRRLGEKLGMIQTQDMHAIKRQLAALLAE